MISLYLDIRLDELMCWIGMGIAWRLETRKGWAQETLVGWLEVGSMVCAINEENQSD